jgi:hypothetical protein
MSGVSGCGRNGLMTIPVKVVSSKSSSGIDNRNDDGSDLGRLTYVSTRPRAPAK